MKASEGSAGNSGSGIGVMLILVGCIILFGAETTQLSIAGALLMAVGLWGLIR